MFIWLVLSGFNNKKSLDVSFCCLNSTNCGAIVRGHVKIEYGTLISNLNVSFAMAKHLKIIVFVFFITDHLDFCIFNKIKHLITC